MERVLFSTKFPNWTEIPKVPLMCWDETRQNYLNPRRALSKTCIELPIVPTEDNKTPGSMTYNFFKTEIGDWGTSAPYQISTFNINNSKIFLSWRRFLCLSDSCNTHIIVPEANTRARLEASIENMIPIQDDPFGADLFDTSRRVNNINKSDWNYKKMYLPYSSFDSS